MRRALLLALLLGSCAMQVPHDAPAILEYRAEVEDVSWKLQVYDPAGSTLEAEYTNDAPGGIVDGFNWSAKPGGGSVQLQFTAIPKLTTSLLIRRPVRLEVNGHAVFWGVLATVWPADDYNAREYVAIGVDDYYSHRYVYDFSWRDKPIEDIVYDLAANFGHGNLITVDRENLAETGQVASIKAPGPVDVHRILDDLASRAGNGYEWGVRSDGSFYFGIPDGAVEIDYLTHGLNWLPVDGSEMVTRGIVYGGEHKAGGRLKVVAEQHTDTPYTATREILGEVNTPVLAKQLIADYQTPEHTQYGLERAAVSPVLVTQWMCSNDWRAPCMQNIIKLANGGVQTFGGAFVCSLSGGPELTYDENQYGGPREDTGWKAVIGKPNGVYTWLQGTWSLYLPRYAAWGGGDSYETSLRVVIHSNRRIGHEIKVTIRVAWFDPESPGIAAFHDFVLDRDIDNVDSDDNEIVFYLHHVPSNATISFIFEPNSNNYTPIACGQSSDWIRVSSALGWGAIIPDAQAAAKSLIRLPYQMPHDVVFDGELVAPAGSVEINTPSGPVSGPVERWEYEYTTEQRSSRAIIGAHGLDDDAAAIRLYVDMTGLRAALTSASVGS